MHSLTGPLYAPNIIGGTPASPSEFPSIVACYYQSYSNYFCGGSILSPWWILTAAHCLAVVPGCTGILVQYGTTTRSSPLTNTKSVTQCIKHSSYLGASTNYQYDIAVIKLSSALIMSSSVQPSYFPAQGYELPNNSVFTSIGWGSTYVSGGTPGPSSTTLQETTLNTVDNPTCKTTYSFLYTSQLCVKDPKGTSGICSGDSGSPGFCGGQQVGLVSFGQKSCPTSAPQVYTKTCMFILWIQSQTGLTRSAAGNFV